MDSNRYVVISERDTDDVFMNGGAICFETYLAHATLANAIERAETLGNRYGAVIICKLQRLGTLEDCINILKGEIEHE